VEAISMRRMVNLGTGIWVLLAGITPIGQGNAAPMPPDGGAEPSPPIAQQLANADLAAGESYAKRVCAACHSLEEGGKAIVGPNLYGVVGGPHAHMQGFNYSEALKARQGPWTYDELNAWLTKPSDYAPGTRMAFPGIKNEKQRIDVIAYLRTLSHNAEPLPSPQTAEKTPTAASQ
jgi:cytochrome c